MSGADQGRAELRPPAIRGTMRFWFRAMMGAVVACDLQALQKLEALVFGITDGRSPFKVRVRLREDTIIIREKGSPLVKDKWSKIYYLAGLGLCEYSRDNKKQFILTRGCYLPDSEFTVTFQVRNVSHAEHLMPVLKETFWLLVNFGGLGARTRRGFGGIRIINKDEEISKEYLMGRVNEIKEIFQKFAEKTCPSALKGSNSGPSPANQPPFSCFADNGYSFVVARRSEETWDKVLSWCGRELRDFRATEPGSTSYNNLTVDYKNVVQRFIDTDESGRCIHRKGRPKKDMTMQNTVFGLPYQITSLHGKPPRRGGELIWGEKSEGNDTVIENSRRSSPLFIRPIRQKNGWAVVFLLFKAQFLPDKAYMVLRATGKEYSWRGRKKPKDLPINPPKDYQLLEDFLAKVEGV